MSLSQTDSTEGQYQERQLIKLWIQANHRRPALSTLTLDKKSSLLKKGSKTQTWHARTFALQGNFLYYFEDKPSESTFKGVVLLKGCTVESMKFFENMSNVLVVQPKYPNRLLKFDAQVAMQSKQVSKKYYISCPTRAIMDDWKKAIELASKFSQVVFPESEQNSIVGIDSEDSERLLRTPSMRTKVNDYQVAAVSFTLNGVSESDDLAAKRLAKKVEHFEARAEMFGPVV